MQKDGKIKDTDRVIVNYEKIIYENLQISKIHQII